MIPRHRGAILGRAPQGQQHNGELEQHLQRKRRDRERAAAAQLAEGHRLGMLERAVRLLGQEAGAPLSYALPS